MFGIESPARWHRVLLSGLVSCLFLLATTPSLEAKPKVPQEAKKAADQAFKFFEEGNYPECARLFAKAAKGYASPVIQYYWAQCTLETGELLRVIELLDAGLAMEIPKGLPHWVKAGRDAKKLRAEVIARIPKITVQLTGNAREDASVTIDGETAEANVALRVDPGEHQVQASANGELASRTIMVEEGETQTIKLVLARENAPETTAADERNWVGPGVSFALGGAALVVAVVTTALFVPAADELLAKCIDRRCPASELDKLDSTMLIGNVSTAAWVLGGVGIAMGTLWILLDTGGEEQAGGAAMSRTAVSRVAVSLGPARVDLRVRF